MSGDNLSAVLFKANELRLEQRPKPGKPDGNHVLLATHTVGICGSDVSYWVRGRIGHFIVNEPMILGHESSATVLEVGPSVKKLKVGDRVAIEPGVPCRHCNHCRGGKYNLCAEVTFAATPPVDGHLTRYFLHPEDFCFKLPDHVSYEEGALLEPLSVAVHACRRAGVEVGTSVLITGAGPIGLMSLLTAKAYGASNICITDINEKRLALAKELGASQVVLIKAGQTAEETSVEVQKALDGMPDITIECSGAEQSIRLSILVTKSGGTLVLVGLGQPEVNIPLVNAAIREVDIKGIFRYRNCYPIALDLVATGKVDVKPLITHRFALEECLDAFTVAKSGEGIKVTIKCAMD